MSSSDSEDDCYGNVASKLQKLKNCFQEDRQNTSALLNDSCDIDILVNENPLHVPVTEPSRETSVASLEDDSSVVGVPETSEIPPKNSRRVTRASRKKQASEPVSEVLEPTPKPKRGRKSNSNAVAENPTPRGRGRGRRSVQTTIDQLLAPSSVNPVPPSPNRGRGRGRRRGRTSLTQAISSALPIYSVGNTYEYPDESENQELFSSKPATTAEVIEIDAEDEDINEELSIKVYWQNTEVFKFTVRRFQKFTQIFDYFTKKANVTKDNLLFTYEERILNLNDTPDSIGYRISKFIDGGVSANKITHSKTEEKIVNGIKIKFQCQSSKKPFETVIGMDNNLKLVMLKCAEHFELDLEKLKFYFDGEIVTGRQTPRDLEFEGGECIDVKCVS